MSEESRRVRTLRLTFFSRPSPCNFSSNRPRLAVLRFVAFNVRSRSPLRFSRSVCFEADC